MSFKQECNYLSGLVSDYKKKLKDPFWDGFNDFFKELVIETERKLSFWNYPPLVTVTMDNPLHENHNTQDY